ncbi:phage tail tape measure protein [Providencia rettgeri]|uniref:phage tail tape measure protein n=1 Tax=Providencia rettgeri TaxID=587 RepID=UPI0018C5CCEA|nr:phage tail tape measure protein [Providencia rettgeri]MBG5930262.1 phage tail tape measure protein [Providencia rettgeri]MCL0019237.1 phage tail tape measure protein [Providencia rettgeri]HEM8125363.1 phage tail tape measure protein [Providencia rettgeri]
MADVASLAVALHLNAASFKSQVFDAYDSASKESKKFAQSASKDAGQTAERLLEVSANARKAGADLSASGQMARSSQLGFGQLRTALTNVSAGSNVATSSLIGGFIPALERSLENVNNVKFSLAEQQRVAQEAAREAINLSRAQIEGAQADRKSAQEKINLAAKMRDEAIARREQAFSLDEYLERQVEVNKQHGISVSYAEEHAKNARVIREANIAEAEAKKRMQSASIEIISANKSELDGKKNLTTATNQLSEASKELTFSQRAAANSASLFKSAWGVMGGAVGIGIMASAGAFTYLHSQYQQAEERQKAFNAALQKGGLGLTTTAYDLRNLANELGGTAEAYKSVTAAASAGFSGDLLHQVSELGVQMEKSGGSVDLLISKLVSIGEQPLTGIKKLIDEGVIVESGIVQRIAQLEREGKAREASELAQISTLQAKTKAENTQSEALKVQKGEVESLRRSYQGLYDITNGSNYAKINTQMNNAFLEEAIRLKKEQSQVQEKQLLEQKEAAYKQLEITTNFNSAFKAGTDQQKERADREKQFKDMLDKGTISATEYQQALKGLDKLFTTPKKTGGSAVVDEGKQRIEQLLQQGAALRAQLEETEGLTASERKLASFEQELIGLQGQHLNARQKTIQAHSSEIRAQLIKNAELEKEIKYKELRKKFDDQNFEVMQRTSKLSQDSSNQMLQMTMSQPAYELMLEEQRVRDDFRQRRYQLDKEVSDKTTQLYADQTLFLSQEEQRQLDIVRQSSRDKLAMNRNATTGMAKGIQDFGNSAENVYDQMRTISNGALSDMSGMLANFVATGKLNFADFAQSIVTEITKMIFQMMIFNALKAGFAGTAFGDAIGAGAAPTPNAKGGTYSSPGLSAYSNTIVKSPTLFPFAKGGAPKMGLMGEAGAEAIMPLTRARDGSLGVRVLGLDAQQQTPNIIIQQTFHLTGNGDQALQEAIQQAAEMGAKQGSQDALAKIQRDFQNNGTLRKSLGR